MGRRSSFQYTRPAEYHAPTWSWASLNGPVEYSTGLCCRADYEINISECHCFPVSPLNPTWSIKSGYIVVTGVLIPVQLVTTRAFFHYSERISDLWRHQAIIVRGENLQSYEVSSDLPREKIQKRDFYAKNAGREEAITRAYVVIDNLARLIARSTA